MSKEQLYHCNEKLKWVATNEPNKVAELIDEKDHKIAVLEKALELTCRKLVKFELREDEKVINKIKNEFIQQAKKEMEEWKLKRLVN